MGLNDVYLPKRNVSKASKGAAGLHPVDSLPGLLDEVLR